jgi:hypothetical protein
MLWASKSSNEYSQHKVEFLRRWNEHPHTLVDDASLTACKRTTLSTTTLHDTDYWRDRAKEARARAAQMSSAEDKRELLKIAKAFERLAEIASVRKL